MKTDLADIVANIQNVCAGASGVFCAIKPKLLIETAIITTNVINLVFIIV